MRRRLHPPDTNMVDHVHVRVFEVCLLLQRSRDLGPAFGVSRYRVSQLESCTPEIDLMSSSPARDSEKSRYFDLSKFAMGSFGRAGRVTPPRTASW